MSKGWVPQTTVDGLPLRQTVVDGTTVDGLPLRPTVVDGTTVDGLPLRQTTVDGLQWYFDRCVFCTQDVTRQSRARVFVAHGGVIALCARPRLTVYRQCSKSRVIADPAVLHETLVFPQGVWRVSTHWFLVATWCLPGVSKT